MISANIPTYWNTLSEEGEKFYNKLAQKYIKLAIARTDKPEVIIAAFIKENLDFINSEDGKLSDAYAKETQNLIIEFLSEIFSDELTSDDVASIYQEIFWN